VAGAAHHRASIGEAMVADVAAAMARHGEVPLKRVLHVASLNHIMATVFGKRYDMGSREGALLDEMVAEGYDLLGTFNWADHLPLLKHLDPQGVRRRCNRLVQKVESFVGKIIMEHRTRRANGGFVSDECIGDFVDVLLGLEGEEKLSDADMIAVLWVITQIEFNSFFSFNLPRKMHVIPSPILNVASFMEKMVALNLRSF
jgi:cytochrome P450 family 78 subfamily A